MIKNPEKSKKIKAAVSILLVVALLVGSAFAFLSASDSKSNVFTVGKVKVELQEYFDANNDDTAELYKSGVTPPTFENILPGQIVEKDPFIVNTGDTDAFVYMAVGLPTTPMDNIYYDADQDDPTPLICDTDISIPIKAFAIQDGYENCTDASSIWDAFVASNENGVYDALGENQSAESAVQLFSTIYNADRTGNTTSDVKWNTDSWTQIGNPIKTVNDDGDTHNYYIFAFNGTADGKLAATQSTFNEARSTSLFTDVKLNESIGEGKPLTVNYYGPEGDQNTLAASSTAPENLPENYTLLYSEEIQPGDILNDLYFDESLSKTGNSMDWTNIATGESLYAGMSVNKSINAIVEYKDLVTNAAEPNTNPTEYDSCGCLVWEFISGGATIKGINSEDTNYPTSPTTIIVPKYITLTKNGSNYTVENGYYFEGGPSLAEKVCTRNVQLSDENFEKYKINETTAQIPVVGISVTGTQVYQAATDLIEIATNFVIPDTVTKLTYLSSPMLTSVLNSINIPYSCQTINAFTFNTNLSNVIIPNNTINIGQNAFVGTSIRDITIPNSVQSVGLNAFSEINTIRISDINKWAEINTASSSTTQNPLISGYNAKLLLNGNELSGALSFNDTVKSIAPGAFKYQDKITSVSLSKTISNIGEEAFNDCDGITYFVVDADNNYYSNDAQGVLFNKDKTELLQYPVANAQSSYNVPNSVTKIDSHSFYQCYNLNNITIPNSVVSVGEEAFMNCGYYNNGSNWINGVLYINNCLVASNNTVSGSLYIKPSTLTIADYTFTNCSNLTEIVFPTNLKNIGKHAFTGCTGLTSLTIPNGIISIGDYAFSGCTNLTSAPIPDSIVHRGEGIFNGCDKLPQPLIIPDGVTSISSDEYQNNATITSVIISDSVTSIAESAFQSCSSLESAKIGAGIESITDYAFALCSKLTTVTISKNTTSIGEGAFAYCDNISSIQYDGTISDWNKISLGMSAFTKSVTVTCTDGTTTVNPS